jgi:superfamily II DNA or RNA helicase
VLSQWTAHLEHLCEQLRTHGRDPLVLKGGMGKKARSAALATLAAPDPTGGLLLATGSYLGEGFDCPQRDTLFLTFPLAFKGRLIQYVGRILRAMDGKQSVEVHDYLDAGVPVLASMHTKRLSAFAALGFDTPRARRRRA